MNDVYLPLARPMYRALLSALYPPAPPPHPPRPPESDRSRCKPASNGNTVNAGNAEGWDEFHFSERDHRECRCNGAEERCSTVRADDVGEFRAEGSGRATKSGGVGAGRGPGDERAEQQKEEGNEDRETRTRAATAGGSSKSPPAHGSPFDLVVVDVGSLGGLEMAQKLVSGHIISRVSEQQDRWSSVELWTEVNERDAAHQPKWKGAGRCDGWDLLPAASKNKAAR